MAPDGDPQIIFMEIDMASDLVELGGLEPLASCMQISRLWPGVKL